MLSGPTCPAAACGEAVGESAGRRGQRCAGAAAMSRRELVRAAGAGAAPGRHGRGCRRPRPLRPSKKRSSSCSPARPRCGPRVRLERRRFDGNTVPLAVAVDSPMTEADHVRRVDVFAEGNPFPEVATFHFTPDSGRASVSTGFLRASRRWSRSRS